MKWHSVLSEQRMISSAAISSIMALLFLANAFATTYYVDRSIGNDSNTGTTEAAPFLTIAKGVQAAKNPGDTCLVKNGTYPEGVLMRYSGSAGHPITLKNFPGHSPKLQFADANVASNRIELVASPYPTLIQYVTIEGLEIAGGYDGIKASVAENIVIRRNYIHDNGAGTVGGNGLLLKGCQITIDRNIIYKNGNFTVPLGHGMYLTGKGYTITNNVIYYNARYGLQGAGYPYSAADMTSTNQSGFQAITANNTFAYNNQRAGITIWNAGGGAPGLLNNRIENNILYENCNISACSGGISGIDFVDAGTAGALVKNNVHYASGTGATNFVGGSGAVAGSTYLLTDNSTATNPNMVNAPATAPVSPDFHLTSGSISAIDHGSNLTADGVVTDFDGVTRPQGSAFDVGAYEYSAGSGIEQNRSSGANAAGAISIRSTGLGGIAIVPASAAQTSVVVYSLNGRQLASFGNIGSKGATWNPKKNLAGVYLVRVQSGNDVQTAKIYCGR